MSNLDLENVVADAVDDSVVDSTDVSTEVDTSSADLSASADAATSDVTEATDPTADPAAAAQDEFEKRWGIPARSVTGRENRIPHSRVKQMVSKAEQDAIARITKELETKWVAEKLQPVEVKVKDYESRLEKVAQFENVLENDPRTFLGLLSQIPAYKDFFDHINKLTQAQPQATTPKVPEGMPQPDQTLPDGTKVYSMDGLQALLQWQAENVEKRVTDKVTKHYAPIEQEWQQQQRMAQLVPVIEKQIADARTWPNFAELEPEVIKILKSDPQISLERAYVKAFNEQVVPKVSADRNKIRTEVLAELKQKPVSSSAPTTAVKPGSQPTGPRSLEQIIEDSVKQAGLM